MGARGPAPKPTVLKVITGNPGKRPLPKNEPKPAPVAPPCPSWLNPTARAEWKRVAPELEKLGLLTRIDMAALASYCVAYSDLVAARREIDGHGFSMEIVTEKGGLYYQQRPEVSIANKAMALIKGFCQEFGLTPSARGRMSVPQRPEGDDDLLD